MPPPPPAPLLAALRAFRAFSTCPRPLRTAPESPSYIEIPRPPHTRTGPGPRPKGKLPHPKSIRETGPATPDPTKPRSPPIGVSPDTVSYIAWKQSLAATRRRNLREGTRELLDRQDAQSRRRAEVLAKRSADREARLAAKQREDVRLTLPSVLSALRVDDGSRIVRLTPEQIEQKRVRHIAKLAAKSDVRVECLHELYLNARSFIVTEAQLDEAIEREFGPKDHLFKTLPQTVEDMLLQVQNTTGTFERDPKVMEIAGQLTGGKWVVERTKVGKTWDEGESGLVGRDF